MSKTDGEYELVLGNRQLLSAFFIVVILFGVFFTMGYVVGRNSAPASAASLPSTTVAGSQRPEAASPAPTPQPAAPPPAQPQAGVVVDTLKQKGFPAMLAQGPNATLFRVMVGPFADAATLGKAKAE